MNTSTEPHLDLDELLAGVAGEPLSEQARDHLESCPGCHRETRRWGATSDGTRLLMTATELPPWQFPMETTGRRPGRRALLTAAAAAAVLAAAGGTTWGLTSGGAVPGAALTAVTGCPGLTATSGTLEQIDGAQLEVRTPSGQTVTVTTNSDTAVSTEVTGSLSDITDGTQVLVRGLPQGTTLAAQNVLANMAQLLPLQGPPRGKIQEPPKARPGPGIAAGTVSDVRADGFTVTPRTGGRVHVTTSAATVVDTLTPGRVGQLRTGVHLIAVGQAGPDGTLAAATVDQGATLPSIAVPPSRSATGTCDPSAVASALAFGG
jgi:hypothetical protein